MSKRSRKPKRRNKPEIVKATYADENHQVLTVVGGDGKFCTKPCAQCPWRKDQVGKFPAEAFRLSANTAYDMSDHVFACHMAGSDKPVTCAGFLMQGADHNMRVRLQVLKGEYKLSDVSNGGIELFENYRAMAEANGVDPDDPVLRDCR